MWGDYKHLLLLITVTWLTYYLGKKVETSGSAGNRPSPKPTAPPKPVTQANGDSGITIIDENSGNLPRISADPEPEKKSADTGLRSFGFGKKSS